MKTAFHFLVALVLLGDYLMLSVSRLTLGSNANWLLLVGCAQALALVLAVALGYARQLRMSIPMLGLLGLGLVMLLHASNRAVTIGEFDDYGGLKTVTFFTIAGPAFVLGSILGQFRSMPGARYFPLLIAPLLLMCVFALLTDPDVMTVRPSTDLAVFLGVLVLPVHQALAFSLGKIAIWLNTTAQRPAQGGPRLLCALGLIGACLGLAILSGSRGYVIAAAFALALQWSIASRRTGLALSLVAVPAALLWLFSDETIHSGFDPATVMDSASVYERVDMFSAAIAAFWERPILGHGPGGFATFYGWHERVYPHNIFLEILCELGLIGIACFAMVLLPVLTRAARLWSRRDPTEVQFFAAGFLLFSIIGALGVADLIRNHFLFLAAGMTAVACAPCAATGRSAAPAAAPIRPATVGSRVP